MRKNGDAENTIRAEEPRYNAATPTQPRSLCQMSNIFKLGSFFPPNATTTDPAALLKSNERMSCEIGYFLTSYLQPSCWTDWIRHQIYHFVESSIWECGENIGLHGQNMKVHLFGSFFLSTYLPEGDIDITVQCPERSVSSLMHRIYDRFLNVGIQVQFVQADVKLIKCYINEICVDISFNQIFGLSTAFFVTEVSKHVPNNLFKRSLVLLKAWAYYECHILGANGGLLGSYALTIMLIAAMNHMHNQVRVTPETTELDVLVNFFDFYSKNDIRHNTISIYGAKSYLSGTDICEVKIPIPIKEEFIVDQNFMKVFRKRNKSFLQQLNLRESMLLTNPHQENLEKDPVYETQTYRQMNIVDPLRPNNNLARGIHLCHAQRIQHSITRDSKKLHLLLSLPKVNPSTDRSQSTALVCRFGRPMGIDLDHPYPHRAACPLGFVILSFFETTFRKCVLPKLLQRESTNPHASKFPGYSSMSFNKFGSQRDYPRVGCKTFNNSRRPILAVPSGNMYIEPNFHIEKTEAAKKYVGRPTWCKIPTSIAASDLVANFKPDGIPPLSRKNNRPNRERTTMNDTGLLKLRYYNGQSIVKPESESSVLRKGNTFYNNSYLWADLDTQSYRAGDLLRPINIKKNARSGLCIRLDLPKTSCLHRNDHLQNTKLDEKKKHSNMKIIHVIHREKSSQAYDPFSYNNLQYLHIQAARTCDNHALQPVQLQQHCELPYHKIRSTPYFSTFHHSHSESLIPKQFSSFLLSDNFPISELCSVGSNYHQRQAHGLFDNRPQLSKNFASKKKSFKNLDENNNNFSSKRSLPIYDSRSNKSLNLKMATKEQRASPIVEKQASKSTASKHGELSSNVYVPPYRRKA